MTNPGRRPTLASRQPSPRRRVWQGMALLGLLAGWLYLFVAGDDGWLALRQRRERLAELEADVARLEAQTDSLRTLLRRLAEDPAFLEKVAREDLGMVRPGEYLYEIRRPGRNP